MATEAIRTPESTDNQVLDILYGKPGKSATRLLPQSSWFWYLCKLPADLARDTLRYYGFYLVTSVRGPAKGLPHEPNYEPFGDYRHIFKSDRGDELILISPKSILVPGA